MKTLPEELKYDLALRIYDLMQYDDHKLARRYVKLIQGIYHRDSAARKFAVTAAAIWNLAKVMLIKDEPYVAYLLTRYEKKVRDIAKYGVDESNGDRIVYRHHTNPEFNIGTWRVRFRISTTDWQLKLVSKMKWWRRIPGWHKREVAFRDWYVGLLDRVKLEADETYAQALEVLKCPEQVSGYREIRYPKQEKTQAYVESLLGGGGPAAAAGAESEKRSILDALRTPTRV
jgi:indolepyruvate ferredoxin oxidoreductase